jgi:hypothetical protein
VSGVEILKSEVFCERGGGIVEVILEAFDYGIGEVVEEG